MVKSVDDRGRGARMAKRDEGAYLQYVTEEQRSPWDASAARATDLAIRGPLGCAHDELGRAGSANARSSLAAPTPSRGNAVFFRSITSEPTSAKVMATGK